MLNDIFYKIIDVQIDDLISLFMHNTFLAKQDSAGKKSFGFLLWFLQRYLPNKPLEELECYITEGDDDNSCDLIFDNLDNEGKQIFYVVQAKWFKEQNINSTNRLTKDVKACITDFRTILKGNKESTNERFIEKYRELLEHKNKNGKITFIFAALCKRPDKIENYKKDLCSKLVSFQMFDIDQLKRDYVEIEYKGIKTHNPIETPYEPKKEINIAIERQNQIELSDKNPYPAYIFLIRSQLIFELFEKFGFALFYKNIRNPIPKSYYNEQIVKTIKLDPLNFWYFNNGITAITDNINDFHQDSCSITVKGLQVINGAQTVYSVYEAYKEASNDERAKMDQDALITFRLLRSGGIGFDMAVTRYTNSQNPISERDFHSNDDVQKRLQDDFLCKTNIWYETRRGEFRKKHRDIQVLENEKLGQAYLACILEEPLLAKSKKALIFISNAQQNKPGFYEKIFNANTKYDDLLISYLLYQYVEKRRKEYKKIIAAIQPNESGKYSASDSKSLEYSFIQYSSFEILSLMRQLVIEVNKKTLKGMNGKLLSDAQKNDCKKIKKYYDYVVQSVKESVSKQTREKNLILSVYFKNKKTYGALLQNLKTKIIKEQAKTRPPLL